MNGMVNRWKGGGAGIGSQVLSIVLLFFFGVVLVNALDLDSIGGSVEGLLGPHRGWSTILFILITAVLYTLVFPSTVLGAASGVSFGIVQGCAVFITATLMASVLVYALARTLLRRPLQGLVRKSEFLQSVEKVIEGEGVRFLFLIRYAPVHATFVSALLGMAGISPRGFFLSCLVLLPEWVLHVYVGYVAASTPALTGTSQWEVADLVRIASMVIAIVAVSYLGWVARKAIERAKP